MNSPRTGVAAALVLCAAAIAGTAVTPSPTPVKRNPVSAERQQALHWLHTMKLREVAAQLIVLKTFGEPPPSRSKEYQEYVHAVRDLRVGGLIVVNRAVNGSIRSAEPYKMVAFLNRMQKLAKVPLLVSADFERGASMRVNDTVKFPHLMAYGAANDPKLTFALGAATAREARALGVHWVFAPDADVNNNPDNPIINTRSFGEDPSLVATHVKAFIEGAHSDRANRVLVSAKHFPGHGDTSVDSHMNLPRLEATRERLNQIELVPFRAAIEAGTDSIMTAHMSVPALDSSEVPATVSEPILTGLLRKEMGFEGIIVTDAMDMQGLMKQFSPGEASVRAVEAGVDVLLMPSDPDAAVQALVRAVAEGRLTRKRLEASALRILMAKARVGLQKSKLTDIEQITDNLDSPESQQQAQEAAEKALTLVRNERQTLPLTEPDSSCLFILTEGRYGQQGRAMLAEAKRLAPKMAATLLDPLAPPIELTDALEKSKPCRTFVVAAFVSAAAYRGNVALGGGFTPFVESLIARGGPVALVAFGSPYLLRYFPGVSAYMATFTTAAPAETAVVRAILGQSPVRGRLPVTIPGVAKPGDGIDLQ
jgi:beta-N-acetylhexosaminidase